MSKHEGIEFITMGDPFKSLNEAFAEMRKQLNRLNEIIKPLFNAIPKEVVEQIRQEDEIDQVQATRFRERTFPSFPHMGILEYGNICFPVPRWPFECRRRM